MITNIVKTKGDYTPDLLERLVVLRWLHTKHDPPHIDVADKFLWSKMVFQICECMCYIGKSLMKVLATTLTSLVVGVTKQER